MAENQETNTFVNAMGTEKNKVSISENEIDKISKYAVNPKAENTINIVATLLLICGIIAAIVFFILGIIDFTWDDVEEGFISWGIGVASFLVGWLEWAALKVFVNISRNLYNINDTLNEIKNK